MRRRQRVRTEELVASHDAIKLLNDESVELIKEAPAKPSLDATWEQQLSVRSTMSQLDFHGSQWQGRGRDQSQIVQEIPHRSSLCNKVVDMPVEVQRQELMVSSNRSHENDHDSVTTNSPRSQC